MPQVVSRDGPLGIACLLHRLVHGFSTTIGTPFGIQIAMGVDDGMDGLARATIRDHPVYDIGAINAIREEGEDLGGSHICLLGKRYGVRRRVVTKAWSGWVRPALELRHAGPYVS